ncbi:MAG TPA: ABC transporter ATP-binding protein [Gemmataceae bacterium]|jgi:ABC-2 type transport system ATP-binding protein
MPASPLLLTENLTKDYGPLRALDALSLRLDPGEVFGLLGPNGSGKSTALRLLLGFLRPTAGRAAIAGHNCWRDGVAARRHVAYLPGELRLYESMTGRQIVQFLARLRGIPVAGDADILAKRFDIDLSRPLVQLSSGMKRKVALLSVLLPRVPLLILDEPTNTLDPTMRDELLAQLREARGRGQTVLFSSHVLAEVEQVCDRVGILQRGKLVHLQSIADLNAEERLIQVRFRSPPGPWPDLPGLEPLTVTDTDARLTHRGPLAPLLDWLGQQPVADLRIEPLGLAGVYARYHGAEA